VNIVTLLPIILIGGMLFLMMRSSKNKQQQAQQMRNTLEPGVGVRTIGGMYALVKEVRDDAVELEVAPGVYALYAKNAIATVMDGVEYNRIVHGDEPEADADDLSELDGDAPIEAQAETESPVLLGKTVDTAGDRTADETADESDKADAPADSVAAVTDAGDKAASSK
jgi:preprotein translocase subunit YajC